MLLDWRTPELSVRNLALNSHRALGADEQDSARTSSDESHRWCDTLFFFFLSFDELKHHQGFRRQSMGGAGFPLLQLGAVGKRCSHASWTSKLLSSPERTPSASDARALRPYLPFHPRRAGTGAFDQQTRGDLFTAMVARLDASTLKKRSGSRCVVGIAGLRGLLVRCLPETDVGS